MSIDRNTLLVALMVAIALSACTEPELPPPQTAQAMPEVPIPNVNYYLPPADTTRPNTSTVPVGTALCPTVTRFGSPIATAASGGCIFR